MRFSVIALALLMMAATPLAAAPVLENHPFVERGDLIDHGKKYDGKEIMSSGKLQIKNMFVVSNVPHYKDVPYLADADDARAPYHFDQGVCLQTEDEVRSGVLARLVGMSLGVSGIYHLPSPDFPAQCRNGTIVVRLIYFKTDD